MPITIHCGNCEGTFDFEHPSVQNAADLRNVTIDCRWCGAILKMPTDEVHMVSMQEYMRRQLVRQGYLKSEDTRPSLSIAEGSPQPTSA